MFIPTPIYFLLQAWIQNATAKSNIIFGQNCCSEERYNEIVEACALKDDFAFLPNGDETEIGENGINLSGMLKKAYLEELNWGVESPTKYGYSF